jgi:hypothetical protein
MNAYYMIAGAALAAISAVLRSAFFPEVDIWFFWWGVTGVFSGGVLVWSMYRSTVKEGADSVVLGLIYILGPGIVLCGMVLGPLLLPIGFAAVARERSYAMKEGEK